ncbi:UDP-N-acetylmuramoyl-tripeptide--D-alanyl-D-alanine ligase [Pseudoteredinibacter isoporae]|uniref:UDP-N-acetylmuramoyl-tripeptide--D-alanyl-D-alanine ligase n=1 Tax=Pseudoteredinibacter isoporae TaxID=570281 RepID=A0A7X0JUX3_9GAMM|nr:UDP-N-acetylmuramoyl-tripeptide--D-alanyl-D-alanine ligase [Pseudoteredinibacter isoporae]MBB6522733.1 UDP-N-acetylmuramoyl-tripeptide--D-alanyl-D-alanine ligase [Pseudoteredinibacter isoporae]NHO88262.1 UDP-N-acetylmuramoyl-tripeptide--D-alanyl-D-alanine ligase [Pseudoteredinibacter isoporae]NIB23407.1 UDP-N-acetylmuramoyl-tripeptide--D-alanyl-D-alanine ligase [Pseudoteredinibacter isoporae]
MFPLSLRQLASALALQVDSDIVVSGLSTDSRAISAGDVFVALRGENFDGHAFLAKAKESGAVAAVVEEVQSDVDLPQLKVPDCYAALASIAQMFRQSFKGPLVGITGSSGKTTVKQMLASIFSRLGPTLATKGNLNNHIGVPLTLMGLQSDTQYAVIEMGASGPGEIAYLSSIAKPGVVMVNNVMAAHLEGFGSLEGVAMAKGEIYQGLDASAKAVINEDCEYADRWASGLAESQIVRYSCGSPQADIFACDIELQDDACYAFELRTPIASAHVRLAMPGRHNVANALAAASCAYACSVSLDTIVEGLQSAKNAGGRMQRHKHSSGAEIIDDSYNANPGSVQAAIDMLADQKGKTILVLGDMGELGSEEKKLHKQIGRYAEDKNISVLYCVGTLSKHAAKHCKVGEHFADKAALLEKLQKELAEQCTVLVKGSRSAAMETVVQALLSDSENGQSTGASC